MSPTCSDPWCPHCGLRWYVVEYVRADDVEERCTARVAARSEQLAEDKFLADTADAVYVKCVRLARDAADGG